MNNTDLLDQYPDTPVVVRTDEATTITARPRRNVNIDGYLDITPAEPSVVRNPDDGTFSLTFPAVLDDPTCHAIWTRLTSSSVEDAERRALLRQYATAVRQCEPGTPECAEATRLLAVQTTRYVMQML